MHQIQIAFTSYYQRRTLVAIAQSDSIKERVKDFLESNAGRVDPIINIYHLWNSSVRYRLDQVGELEVNIALDFTARTKRELRQSMGIILEVFPDIFHMYHSMPDPLLQLRIGTLTKTR